MSALPDLLTPWRSFYDLLGSAAATMIGLLFVAATVRVGIFSTDRRAALRMFLSASVVHFTGILVICLIVLAPLQSPFTFGVLVAACGTFGLTYYGMAWRDTVRDGLNKKIDLEDRTWYAGLPVIVYLSETAAGVAMAFRPSLACPALALTVGLLLLIGIHNAWDITVWSITRRQD